MNQIELNLDSTVLSSSACILRLHRKIVGELVDGAPTGGYSEKAKDCSLIYGIAVHKFIDTMYKSGGLMPKAIAAARLSFSQPKVDNPKAKHLSDEKHLLSVCMNLWEKIQEDSSFDVFEMMDDCYRCKGEGMIKWEKKLETGTPMYGASTCEVCKGAKQVIQPSTEKTFSIPYYSDDYVRINLCGTIDRIGKFKNGCYAIRDWKTTSSWDEEEYFKQYELSRQLRLYRLACQLMYQKHPDSVLGKIGATNMGVCIDGIFLKANSNEVELRTSDVYTIKQNDLDAFALTLDDTCRRVSSAIKTGYLPKEGIINGSCGYGKMRCSFWDACSHDDAIAQVILKRNFIQKPFSPLTYNEI